MYIVFHKLNSNINHLVLSINRRLPPVRSLTLPASTSTTTTRTTTTTTTASTIQESSSSSYTGTKDIESFLPSIDESLQIG
ncbi:unnamed protein product [Cunninghamella echinulata]